MRWQGQGQGLHGGCECNQKQFATIAGLQRQQKIKFGWWVQRHEDPQDKGWMRAHNQPD